MTVFSASLPRAVLFGAALLPGSAFAELAANDVWQHFQTLSALYGGALEGETSTQGDTLKISDMQFAADLPFGAGHINISLGDMLLREEAGGTVSLNYPSTMVLNLTYRSPEGESFGGGMTVTHQDLRSTASGRPGEITFDYTASRIDMALDVPELPEGMQNYSVSGFLTDIAGSSVQRLAGSLEAESQITMGEYAFIADQAMALDDETGNMQIKNSSGGESMAATGKLTIPEGGINLANLAMALRDGLAISGTANISDYTTNQVVAQDGAVMTRMDMTAASYASTIALDTNGVLVESPTKDTRIEFEMPAMGGMIFGGNIASADGKLRAPLLMEEGFAPAEMSLDITGLSPDETLWAMVDPTGILPRDPANLSLDLSADIRHRIEWLDFAKVENTIDTLSGLPIEPQSARLNTLRLSAAGAEITGEGAFTFDLSDLQSFDGMPRPEGKLTLRTTGLNALSQKLLQMGMPQDQITSGMMMLGMFTAPDPERGDDARMTVLEVIRDGQVLNNGMRIR